jgi:hypothetical protein
LQVEKSSTAIVAPRTSQENVVELMAKVRTRYEGEFCNGVKHGKGIEVRESEYVYIGNYRDGLWDGNGQLRQTDGCEYKGDFLRGIKHGKGTFQNVHDGSKYVGEFCNDVKCGNGTITLKDYTQLIGTFVDDVIHGTCTAMRHSGDVGFEIQQGYWIKGEFVHWLGQPISDGATNQFIEFCNKGLYDDTFLLGVARRLPIVPDGVDPNNAEVRKLVLRIAIDAGDIAGELTRQDWPPKIEEASVAHANAIRKCEAKEALLSRKRSALEEAESTLMESIGALQRVTKLQEALDLEVNFFHVYFLSSHDSLMLTVNNKLCSLSNIGPATHLIHERKWNL